MAMLVLIDYKMTVKFRMYDVRPAKFYENIFANEF